MHRLVIALVTLLGLTGVAVVAGYLFLFSAGTDRAARLAPADTAVYVNVYLQPSTGQQMNLAELIGRLPGFADDASLDDKVDQIVQNLLAGTGIDYRSDVKPWLGDQLALAVRPQGADPAAADPTVIVEVTDREAAEASIADVAGGAGASFTARAYEGTEIQVADTAAYAFVEDMLVVGPDAESIEAVVDVANGGEALADRGDFRARMEALPTDHLAAVFVDVAAMARAAEAEDELDAVSTAGAVLVAESDGLRLSGSAPLATDDAASATGVALGGEPSSLVDWMPADTLAEVVVFGLRQTLEDAEAAAASTPEGEELTSALDTFRAIVGFGLGIDLDADVLPLLDRETGIAFGGFRGDLPRGQLLLRPEDAEAAAASLATIADRLGGVGAETTTEQVGDVAITVLAIPELGDVAYTVTDGVVIVALGLEDVVAAIEAHDAGTSLGQSERYRRSFEVAGTRAGTEGWIDVAAMVDLLAPPEITGDARDILDQIGTFAFTAPSRDDEIEFHAVLTVDETRPD